MAIPERRRRRAVATIPDRYRELMDGKIAIEDLDDEEIMRGQLKNSQGDFRGRQPKFVPREMMQALIEERDRRLAAKFMPLAEDAITTLRGAMRDGTTVHDGPRIQAAKLALEYSVGKPTEKIAIQANVHVNTYNHVVEAVLVDADNEEDTL